MNLFIIYSKDYSGNKIETSTTWAITKLPYPNLMVVNIIK